ncbi:MAG TPA: ribose-phosphate pyrophosphokinase-like domain-containing protein, partial [Candidatus Omnitrophota bacterium]|nr:ribose-phosphate pyrophosphokinase-like domain-containing protein [Candidatus Omnitrophota bacterium]
DAIFLYVCNKLSYYDGSTLMNFPGCLPPLVNKKELGIWVHRVLYQHARFQTDAQEAANIINAHAERIKIEKNTDNPLGWGISLPDGLKGQNVVLVHSTENNLDIVELWLMLLALRRSGAGSVSLINTYAGYSRQDKVFRIGEGASASTMLKIASALTDTYFVSNIHYGGKSGFIGLNGYPFKLYNVNAFVQLAEKLFDFIARQVEALGSRQLLAELQFHPILVLAPDDGASEYVKEAAEVLTHYILDKYGLVVKIYFGYMDKVRTGSTSVEIPAYILSAPGEYLEQAGEVDVNQCWVFLLDDETSWGTTNLSATYVLRRGMGFAWPRILSGVVHGKFAQGLAPFKSGRNEQEILSAIQEGIDLEPLPEYINEEKKLMPVRLIVATKSVAKALALPQEQQVSIGPLISYAVKRVIGNASKDNAFMEFLKRFVFPHDFSCASCELTLQENQELGSLLSAAKAAIFAQEPEYLEEKEKTGALLNELGYRELAQRLKGTVVVNAPPQLASFLRRFESKHRLKLYQCNINFGSKNYIIIHRPANLKSRLAHEISALQGNPEKENKKLEEFVVSLSKSDKGSLIFSDERRLLRLSKRYIPDFASEGILIGSLAWLIAREAGLPEVFQEFLYKAGMVHDLGEGDPLLNRRDRRTVRPARFFHGLMAFAHASFTSRILKNNGIQLMPWEDEILSHHNYYENLYFSSAIIRRLWVILELSDRIISRHLAGARPGIKLPQIKLQNTIMELEKYFDSDYGVLGGGRGVLPAEEKEILNIIRSLQGSLEFMAIINLALNRTLPLDELYSATSSSFAELKEEFTFFLYNTFEEGVFVTENNIRSEMPLSLRSKIAFGVMPDILKQLCRENKIARMSLPVEGQGYLLLDLNKNGARSPLAAKIEGSCFYTGFSSGIKDILDSGHFKFLPRNLRGYYLKEDYLKLTSSGQAVIDLFIEIYVGLVRLFTENYSVKTLSEEEIRSFIDVFTEDFFSEENLQRLWMNDRCRVLGNPKETPMTEDFKGGFSELIADKNRVKEILLRMALAFSSFSQEMPKIQTIRKKKEIIGQLERAMSQGLSGLFEIYPFLRSFSVINAENPFYGKMINFYSYIFSIVCEPFYANKATFILYLAGELKRQAIFGEEDFFKQDKERANLGALTAFSSFYKAFADILGWDIPSQINVAWGLNRDNEIGKYIRQAETESQSEMADFINCGRLPKDVEEIWGDYLELAPGNNTEHLEFLKRLLLLRNSLERIALICAAANAMDFGDKAFQDDSGRTDFKEEQWLCDQIEKEKNKGLQANHIEEFFEILAGPILKLEIKKLSGQEITDLQRPRVIVLTDNAGETVFVMLLVQFLLDAGFNVTIASRDIPVINDMTAQDTSALIRELRFRGYFERYDHDRLKVISSGSRIFATPIMQLSSAFKSDYDAKNTVCVVAMGQGNSESLWQAKWDKPFVHILYTKNPEKIEELSSSIDKRSSLLLVNMPMSSTWKDKICLQDSPHLLAALHALGGIQIIHEEKIYIIKEEFNPDELVAEFSACFKGRNILLDASEGTIYLGKVTIGEGVTIRGQGQTILRGGVIMKPGVIIENSRIELPVVIKENERVADRHFVIANEGSITRLRREKIDINGKIVERDTDDVVKIGKGKGEMEVAKSLLPSGLCALSLNKPLARILTDKGVDISGDMSTIFVSDQAQIGPGVNLHAQVILSGETAIGVSADIGPEVRLDNCKVEDGVKLSNIVAVNCIFHSAIEIEGIKSLADEEIYPYPYQEIPEGMELTGVIVDPELIKGVHGITALRFKRKTQSRSYNLIPDTKADPHLNFSEIRKNYPELLDGLKRQAQESISVARASFQDDKNLTAAHFKKIQETIDFILADHVLDDLNWYEVKGILWQVIWLYAKSPFYQEKKAADDLALKDVPHLLNLLDRINYGNSENILRRRLALAMEIAALSNINVFDRAKKYDPDDPVTQLSYKFDGIMGLVRGMMHPDYIFYALNQHFEIKMLDEVIDCLLAAPEEERKDKTVIFNINNAGEAIYCLVLIREILRLGYKVVITANDKPIDDNYDMADLREIFDNPLVTSPEFLGKFIDAGRLFKISNGSCTSGLNLAAVSKKFYDLAIDRQTVIMFSMGYDLTWDSQDHSLPFNSASLLWVKNKIIIKGIMDLTSLRGTAAIIFRTKSQRSELNFYSLDVTEEARQRLDAKIIEDNRAVYDQEISRDLAFLTQVLGRAPPLVSFITTANRSLTQGKVAACDIDNKIVYIHPYFFELPFAKQLEILYHELISHIAKGIRDEN